MSQNGILLVLSGPSGVGKGTVIHELLAHGEEQCGKKMFLSVSATTRSPRPGEADGVHYYFIGRERFTEMIAENAFLEHASYAGNLYGTPKAPVRERLARGEVIVLDIDVQGAYQIKASMPEAVLVFLAPPSMEELAQRLRGRKTETEDVILRRLEIAERECAQKDRFDYCICNDTVADAVEKICNIVRQTSVVEESRRKNK